MARSNPTYYINPNSISVTPNANGNANDLAVYIQRDTKIKVFVTSEYSDFHYDDNGNYKQWTLSGRNRRLNTTATGGGTYTGAYTIYARLEYPWATNSGSADQGNAYLLFAKKIPYNGTYIDKYPYLTPNGYEGYVPGVNNYYLGNYGIVKLGEVSPIGTDPSDTETYGKRTVTLDTGILGTDQYNNEWKVIEDSQPLRVELANDRNDADPPYVEWGSSITLHASLVKGWETDAGDLVDHWSVERDTDSSSDDDDWNDAHANVPMSTVGLTLQHLKGSTDDFNGAVAAVFTVKAYGDSSSSDSSGEPEIVVLAQGSITILAEAEATYGLAASEYAIHYDPMVIGSGGYSPSAISIRVKATAEDGTVSQASKSAIDNARLTLTYDKNDTSYQLPFDNDGVATLQASVFTDKQSHTLTLRNAAGTVVASETVAFVQDGNPGTDGTDGINTATIYIYKRSSTAPALNDVPGDMFYRFSTGKFYVAADPLAHEVYPPFNGWWREVPPGSDPCYVRQVSVQGTDEYQEVEGTDWSTAALLAKDGESITKAGETYRYATNSTGIRPAADSQDWDTVKPTLLKGYWLYTETTIAWSDGSETVLYTDERNPNDGEAGQDIVVDGATVVDYCCTQSGTQVPSSGWTSLDQVTQNPGWWLWSRATTNYKKATDGTSAGSSVNYNVAYIAKDGTGIEMKGTVDLLFDPASSSSSSSDSSSSDSSSSDSSSSDSSDSSEELTSLDGLTGMSVGDCWVVDETRHLYSYDGTSHETGVPAGWHDMGEFKGEPGRGVRSITEYYKANNSTTAPQVDDSAWDTDPNLSHRPSTEQWDADHIYLWNYEKIEYSSGTRYERTVPQIVAIWTENGKGIDSIANYYKITSTDEAPGRPLVDGTDGWDDDPTAPMPGEYLWNYEKVTYTDGSAPYYSDVQMIGHYGQDGDDGESPYVASLDTEVGTVHTTGSDKPTKAQSVYAVVSLRKGETDVAPSVTAVKRNGSSFPLGTARHGVTVSYNSGTRLITIAYTAGASIEGGMDRFTFTIAHISGSSTLFSEDKTFTVNALSSDQYSLLPSEQQIIVQRTTGGFIPVTFSLTCGYTKTDIDSQVTTVADVTGQIDGLYNLYFRKHNRESGVWDNSYWLYSAWAQGGDSSSSDSDSSEGGGLLVDVPTACCDAVEFILCKNTESTVLASSVTGQTASLSVPVLTNGSVGATGPSYYYLGEWADKTSGDYIPDGTTIQTTEFERPFVSYTDQNGTMLYYLYIGDGSIQAPTTATEESRRDNPYVVAPAYWEQMQSQNKYIIAKAIFSKYANFGGAIFNGDWLLSSNGHIGNNSFESSDRISVSTFGSDTTELVVPHALFDIQNPSKDSEQQYAEDFDSSQPVITPDTPGHKCEIAGGNGFRLEEGKTYYVRAYAYTTGSELNVQHLPHYYLQLLNGNGGSLNIVDLFTQDGISWRNNIAFFRVADTGTYYFGIEATPKKKVGEADEYGRLWMETWSFGIAHFVPRYAVDFLAGMVIQGHGLSSGAQRRAKTILDAATFDYYTKDYHGERMIDFEACGTFMEIKDGYQPLLQLPVFCITGTKPNWSGSTITGYVPYTDEDRDYARSFVGTKLLIYVTDGGIRCSYYHYGYHGGSTQSWATSTEDFCFVYKQSRDTGEASATFKTETLETVEGEVPGGYGPVLAFPQFFEIECCTGCDKDGEIVYWRVNAVGKMA